MIIKLFLLILLCVFNTAYGAESSVDMPHVPSLMPSKEEILRVKDDDITIGCTDAPNVVIEYSSLSCPHCSIYYKDIFPQIKSELIKTCKVKYIYRDFPLTKSALKGVALARCVTMDNHGKIASQEFFNIIQTLFASQDSWAFSSDFEQNLSKILNITGIPQSTIIACNNKKDIAVEVISNAFIAMKVLNIGHSPAIFVNGIEAKTPTFEGIKQMLK